MEEQSSETVAKLKESYQKFRRSCDQVILLNNAISDAQIRFQRAASDGRPAIRYTLRMKVHTLERVRDLFHRYSHDLAMVMNELQARIIQENCVDLLVVLTEMGVMPQWTSEER